MKRCCRNVVEADDRNILWYPQSSLLEGTYGPNSGNVVVGKQGAKRAPFLYEFLAERVAEVGCGVGCVNLDHEFRINLQANFCSYVFHGAPARMRVRALGMSLQKSDPPVAKSKQVFKSQVSRMAMV